MLAFDLDGVFISELVSNPDSELLQVITSKADNILPFFKCGKPYYIITSRNVVHIEDTKHWFDAMFEPEERPVKIFHENGSADTAVEYKSFVINKHPEITTYFESDIHQVNELKALVKCRVVHFEEIIALALEAYSEEA
jgi:hypothetical protein